MFTTKVHILCRELILQIYTFTNEKVTNLHIYISESKCIMGQIKQFFFSFHCPFTLMRLPIIIYEGHASGNKIFSLQIEKSLFTSVDYEVNETGG